MAGEWADDRVVLEITGDDREEFLQGLVTNDIALAKSGLVYTAMLTPQGKYLADFFVTERDDAFLIDVKAELADALACRLGMYKLRAKVTIGDSGLQVSRGIGPAPVGALQDPRDPSMGWRYYGTDKGDAPAIDWDTLRVAACIPEAGIELVPEQSYILESGFERLNGVDFRKGCYVGQEVTARMKHKTELRKGLATVEVDGHAPAGTAILANGREAGTLYTQSGGRGIAYLRFDRATEDMMAGDAKVRLDASGRAQPGREG